MIPATLHMTEADVRSLPPVVDVPTAAAVLGIGRTAAYELIRCGKWPTPCFGSASSSGSHPHRCSTW
jgi:predicted DNA-binding transcriptional regulator AlpA